MAADRHVGFRKKRCNSGTDGPDFTKFDTLKQNNTPVLMVYLKIRSIRYPKWRPTAIFDL
jgi:hypothetical protein